MRMREALPHQKDYKLQRCLRQLAQASVVESGETSRPQEVDCPGAWLFAILASVTWGPGWVSPRGPSGRPCLRANMNLERVSNEEKLNLCRKYYLGGFAFLPFLWLVNIFWFFREAFLVPAYTEQSQIKGYVWRSAVGFLFWVIILTTWITIFQIYRPRWGALGDYLSFTIPLGTP
ncbi:gamma-secretase subunit PEN-2 [Equus asinus]|nr:gamma-secretase subunit PEN-2 [Equus caballus]XP_008540556.1 PREDICTED: gamma-secretase subunit PEN-2 [Equus przewalskii]XP_014693758.1 gamma-secretase subunit PEN-2 [Equus asinus]